MARSTLADRARHILDAIAGSETFAAGQDLVRGYAPPDRP